MKILITGGAGFLGFHLAKHFYSEGNELVLVDNFGRGVSDAEFSSFAKLPKVKVVEKNLISEDVNGLGSEFDLIFHFAAIIGVRHVLERPYSVLSDNIAMHVRMLEFSKRQKTLKRFVFASTSEVYAGTLAHYGLKFPTPEDTPLALPDLSSPRTSYMLSKIYGEALCRQSGIAFSIIRPHNLYGPRMGMSHVIPELLGRAVRLEGNAALEIFSPEHTRTFCYVEDAVKMISLLAAAPAAEGQAFNIGCDKPEITMKDLGSLILKVINRKNSVSSGTDTPGSPVRRVPDISKVVSVTKYAPQVSLEEGIRRTYDWYRTHIFDGKEVCAQ